jgi:trehalose 2-sulfotransferase
MRDRSIADSTSASAVGIGDTESMSDVPVSKRRGVYDLVTEVANYPQWTCRPKRTILICTQQRSGSTLLGEAMYFAGGLGCPLEYFHAGFRPGFESRWAAETSNDFRKSLYRFRTDPTGTLSVKLFWVDVIDLLQEYGGSTFDHLARAQAPFVVNDAYRQMMTILSELFPNPTFVFLTRRDQVGQAVSLSIASQGRNWRWFAGAPKRYALRKLKYDFDGIMRIVAKIQRDNGHWNKFFDANGIIPFRIVYEELASDYVGILGKAFAYLGRPDAAIPPPRLNKQADERSDAFCARFLSEFRQKFGTSLKVEN